MTEKIKHTDVKTILKPRVYWVGFQEVGHGMLDFLIDHGVQWQTDSDVGSEVITEAAGRICYHSFAKPRPGGNHAYLKHIKEVGHGSVLEHAVYTLTITGVSRSLTHELVRHRAGCSYSQRSQRYCDESDLEFVVPPELMEEYAYYQRWLEGDEGDLTQEEYLKWEKGILAVSVVMSAWATTQNAYRYVSDYLTDKLTKTAVPAFNLECNRCDGLKQVVQITHPNGTVGVSPAYPHLTSTHTVYPCAQCSAKSALSQEQKTEIRKRARGTARCVLPNATETKITMTANARAWRTVLEQRGSRHAEMEIRRLANEILDLLVRKAPNLFGDYELEHLPDGTYEITTPYPKI